MEDLAFLVNSLGLEDMTLVGWSMGGAIIQTYLEQLGDDRVWAIGFLQQLPYYYVDDDWEFGVFTEESLAQLVGSFEANRDDRFLLRGLRGAKAEWSLFFATHNLQKLWRSGWSTDSGNTGVGAARTPG